MQHKGTQVSEVWDKLILTSLEQTNGGKLLEILSLILIAWSTYSQDSISTICVLSRPRFHGDGSYWLY